MLNIKKKTHFEFLAFTICLAKGCVSFLVHALLPAMLLPVCQRGWGAYIFGGGGARHAFNCRVLTQERKKKKRLEINVSGTKFVCTNQSALYSPTLWAWLDSVEGHRWTPLLPLRNRAPPSPSISSTCRRLLALTGTKETTAGMHLIKDELRQRSNEKKKDSNSVWTPAK